MATRSVTHAAAGIVAFLGSLLTLPPIAAADPPPGFPNLQAFTAVDPSDYTGFAGEFRFTAPDGVWCHGTANSTPVAMVDCAGTMPGMSDADDGGYECTEVSGEPPPFVIFRRGGSCMPHPIFANPLNAGQKLETTDTTCVVGEDDLLACITRDHGFVVQRSGSWVF